jgi:hypothetical protein
LRKVESIDFHAHRLYAYIAGNRGKSIVIHLRVLLMVLIVLRLLMPPGICACKWSSPAARLLLGITKSERQIPSEPQRENEDDHDAGCPASPLSTGMGVAPPFDPLLPPGLALDPLPPPQETLLFCSISTEQVTFSRFKTTSAPLYLTVRALLL